MAPHPSTHGHSPRGKLTRTYRTWIAIIQRTGNPKYSRYADYGGRGITMCQRWRKSFSAFLADMGECPPGKSIDRIDNNGNYEPGNCRWATVEEQVKNKRVRRDRVELTGQRFTRLTVLRFSHRNWQGRGYWLCRCDCGKEKTIFANNLKAGKIRSCGCLRQNRSVENS